MWNVNLSSLAAKAKEAAARLESQLDDSIGIADDSLFGNKNKSTAAASSGLEGVQENDAFADDDFFSDDNEIDTGKSESFKSETAAEQGDEQVTKLDVTAEEGVNFFDENEQNNEEEEVDFGGGGDGWDEGEDIALDDDFVDEQHVATPEMQINTFYEGADTLVDMPTEPIQATESIDLHQSSFDAADVKPAEVEESSTIVDLPPPPADVEESSTMVDMPPPPDEEATKELNEIKTAEQIEEPEPTVAEPIQEPELVAEPERTEDYLYGEHETSETVAESEPSSEPIDESAPESSVMPVDDQTELIVQSDDVYNSSMPTPVQMDESEKLQFLQTISQLEAQLLYREEQLASKSEQITSLTMQHEAEKAKLREKISETKEEAKKRILKAKERVDEMQTKLSEAVKRADSAGGSSHEQSEIIAALRAEGEQLARKQSQMEQSVRSAKTEARDLAEQLQIQTQAKETALEKIKGLEQDIKSLKDELSSARKGESQSKKLEGVLVAAKEESEKQRIANLGLEQQLSELKEENKILKKEAEEAKTGAALESERESNKLRKERDDMLGDLESKLRTSEREANVREDALRHEVSELRKRWQDAVRRAEGRIYLKECVLLLLV
jgi:hypothetical protein